MFYLTEIKIFEFQMVQGTNNLMIKIFFFLSNSLGFNS